jgi:hypothetical protein
VYHLELRQFPHVARVFNLDREQLDGRFARPWVSGTTIRHDDQQFSADKGKLTIYEGPQLRADEMGMGRGWANVGRNSQDVTATILEEAARGAQASSTVQRFKRALHDKAARRELTFVEVIAMAASEYPEWRASEQLALAEQAVWEMLHQRTLVLVRSGAPVNSAEWQSIVVSWATWGGGGPGELTLRAAAG